MCARPHDENPQRVSGIIRFAVLGCLLLSAPQGTASEKAADSTAAEQPDFEVPAILIQAPRPIATVGGASAVEVRVDSMALPAAPTVEQVLRDLPLLHVRTNSRGESEVSARGSESRQVAVLVDGVPITLAWDARADLSVIPATALQDVVFVRGLSSMLHGPNVLGGIVEARVAQRFEASTTRELHVTMGADNLGTHGTTVKTTLPFSIGRGQSQVRFGVGYRDTPGQPLADGVVEPLPDDDGLRVNTDAANVNGFVAFRHQARGGAWASFSGSSFKEERGIAAELGVAGARFWRYPHVSRTLAVLSAGSGDRASPLGGRGDVEASVGFDRGRTDIDGYTSRAYDQIDSFEDGRGRTLTLRILGDQSLTRRGELRGAFTLSRIRHREIIPDGEFVYRQRLWSVGVENIWRLVERGRAVRFLTVSVGGAHDVGETPEAGGREPLDRLSEWGGRAGVTMGLGSGNAVVHASVSRRGRFPSLRELYSGSLDRFAPIPDLEPERLVSMEAGGTTRVGDGEVQLVLFHNRLDDAVVRVALEDGTFMRVNRNELRSTGLELVASQAFGPVALSGHLMIQDVELRDTEANETHKPENLPEALGGSSARFPLFLGLVGGADVEYTGSQFCIDPGSGEDAELARGAIVGGFVSRGWPVRASWGAGSFTRLEARVAIDNAADTALFDQCGLPRPGRRARFEIRLH